MKELIGKTILFASHIARLDGVVLSGRVREVSPSGNYARIDYSWYAVDKVSVLEIVEGREASGEATDVQTPGPGGSPSLTVVPSTTATA